nr:PLD nuclease N-terminal domain-containing protein [Motilibacter aurantiacus]
MRVLTVLIPLALLVWALVDCLQTREEDIKGMPKVLWVLFMLLIPLVGSLVWIFAGKDRRRQRPAGNGQPYAAGPAGPYGGSRPVAPDDDPNFLERLRLHKLEQDLKAREEKLRREEGGDDDRRP